MKQFIIISLLLILAGCSTAPIGNPINFAKLERVTLGYSSQDDVKTVFGYPQAVLYESGRTIYVYRYWNGSNTSTVRQGVDFVFNTNQRLIDITINDGFKWLDNSPDKQESKPMVY